MSKLAESVVGSNKSGGTGTIESVADILDRELHPLIGEWFIRVEKEPELKRIPLNYEERTGHLPRLMHDVNVRLRRDEETKALISEAAADHGKLRHRQGYPAHRSRRPPSDCRRQIPAMNSWDHHSLSFKRILIIVPLAF